jgi:hypothetical protein
MVSSAPAAKFCPQIGHAFFQFLNRFLSISILIHVNKNLGLAFAASATDFRNFFERHLCISPLKHLELPPRMSF